MVVSRDPLSVGYNFQRADTPSPNNDSMSKCRELCAQNLCGAYGVTWGCPPGIGSPKECLHAIGEYSNAAVIMKKFEKVDFNDKELMTKLQNDHQDVCRRFANALRKDGYGVLPLADGGCSYCGECSYPDEPCRFPDQKIPSVSCYGILMDEYLPSQGIDFSFEKDGMTLYGVILYNEP